jgi:hypothetical protein
MLAMMEEHVEIFSLTRLKVPSVHKTNTQTIRQYEKDRKVEDYNSSPGVIEGIRDHIVSPVTLNRL